MREQRLTNLNGNSATIHLPNGHLVRLDMIGHVGVTDRGTLVVKDATGFPLATIHVDDVSPDWNTDFDEVRHDIDRMRKDRMLGRDIRRPKWEADFWGDDYS